MTTAPPPASPPAPKPPSLLELARQRFTDLTPAESLLFEKTEAGANAVCADNRPSDDPSEWTDQQRIRADRLHWLLTDRHAQQHITHRGVQLRGAGVAGSLDLNGAEMNQKLVFDQCVFDADLVLYDAKLKGLLLLGCHTQSISADRVDISGPLFMRDGFQATGEVRLLGAKIGGNLACNKGQFRNATGVALSADGINVHGDVFLDDAFESLGEARLLGAKIGGDLVCKTCRFRNATGVALNADRIDVKGGVFLNDAFESLGEVRMLGAKIGGNLACNKGHFQNKTGVALNADGIDVKRNVFLGNGFKAQGQVVLIVARIGNNLDCTKGTIQTGGAIALSADSLQVDGSVFLRGDFEVDGGVDLIGAKIGGNLDLRRSRFRNADGVALNADGVKVVGDALLSAGFEARGEVRLLGAKIGIGLDCSGATLSHGLSADGVNVNGDLLLGYGLESHAEVGIPGATIGGDLDCGGDPQNGGGRFNNADDIALNADGVHIRGDVFLRDGFRARGQVSFDGAEVAGSFQWHGLADPKEASLNLESAHVGTLADAPDSWPEPGGLWLHGFRCDRLSTDALAIDIDKRIGWLRLQYDPEEKKPQFRPRAYEQFAGVLRNGGHLDDAKRVLIAKEQDRLKYGQLGGWHKMWRRALGLLIGYGHHPWRAAGFSAAIILAGMLVFQCAHTQDHIRPTGSAAFIKSPTGDQWVNNPSYPEFNPFIYSVDEFVPLVNLHQAQFYTVVSGGWVRWYLWLHILSGWTLSTLLAVGLSGLIVR